MVHRRNVFNRKPFFLEFQATSDSRVQNPEPRTQHCQIKLHENKKIWAGHRWRRVEVWWFCGTSRFWKLNSQHHVLVTANSRGLLTVSLCKCNQAVNVRLYTKSNVQAMSAGPAFIIETFFYSTARFNFPKIGVQTTQKTHQSIFTQLIRMRWTMPLHGNVRQTLFWSYHEKVLWVNACIKILVLIMFRLSTTNRGKVVNRKHHATQQFKRKMFTNLGIIAQMWFNFQIQSRCTPALLLEWLHNYKSYGTATSSW